MPAFQYTAVDKQGKEQSGIIEADNARSLRQQLRDKSLMPLSVTEVNQRKASKDDNKKSSKGGLSVSSVNHNDVVLFTRQLAVLLTAGMPLEEALKGTAEQSARGAVASMIMSVRSKVLEGHGLAAGLALYPSVFSSMFIATIRSGEESGHLDQVLENLADYTEKQSTIRGKIKQAAIYPSMMIIVSFGIVAFLLAYVVPKLVTLFENSDTALPTVTIVVLTLSNWVKDFGLIALGVLAVLIVIYKRLLKIRTFKFSRDKFILRLPVLGRTTKTINTARYARTFGILSKAGLPVLEAMKASSEVVTCLPIQERLNEATKKVREGVAISKALTQTEYFPPMSVHLIASGESSGQLAPMLEKAADSQDKDVENLINSAVSLFEPVMTLVMGAVVLTIVLAVMLPIFALSQMAG